MKLVIISKLNQGKEFPIQDGNNLIGRWDPDDKSFPEIDLEQEDEDAKVSRRHCVVERKENEVTIEDIGSLNGTYINSTIKLEKGMKHTLSKDDQILIGRILLRFDPN